MRVITLLREGVMLQSACIKAQISRTACVSYIREHVELQAMWDEAINESYDTQAEALVDPTLWPTSDPKEAKVWSDNVKWVLGRRRPDLYGDRIRVEDFGGKADQVIVAALRAAIERIPIPPNHAQPPMIDITPDPEPVPAPRELTAEDLM